MLDMTPVPQSRNRMRLPMVSRKMQIPQGLWQSKLKLKIDLVFGFRHPRAVVIGVKVS
jgi:hypothetical protein